MTDTLDPPIFWTMSAQASQVRAILGPEGVLVRALPGFSFRRSQLDMALLLSRAFEEDLPAIVEAGTGTGKTFGYLVPVILSGKKAVLSTATKNLQEQIFFKDLPLLRQATGLRVDAVIMKGRRNYLCLHKYHQQFSQSSLLDPGKEHLRRQLEEWISHTEQGDFAELSRIEEGDPILAALSCPSDECLGGDCLFLDECFLGNLRNRAARARLIVVNHHLFFADLKVKQGGFGEIIPRFQVAIFDEAHAVEETATAYLGERWSTHQVMELVRDLEREIEDGEDSDKRRIQECMRRLKAGIERLKGFFSGRGDKERMDPEVLSGLREGPARDIRRDLKTLAEDSGISERDDLRIQALLFRAGELSRTLDDVVKERKGAWLNWYEQRKRALVLHASPLDISAPMKEQLYRRVRSVAFASATLSTSGTFDFIRRRLGIPDEALEGLFPSEFDFEQQALMYIPRDLPKPGSPAFAEEAASRILDIVGRTQGRMLALFTSYNNLNLVHGILDGRIPYTVYRQGDAPRSALLEAFKQDIHSVLLATGSFWQGVDVPGEALTCLVIDKLPFDSPAEPLVAARIQAIRENGEDPFMTYQVPSAVIAFKQGLGRLIRKDSDRGILAVLDVRVLESRYGHRFLESLPRMTVTHELNDISRFLETKPDV